MLKQNIFFKIYNSSTHKDIEIKLNTVALSLSSMTIRLLVRYPNKMK